MIKFIKKHQKILLVVCDILVLPTMLVFHLITDYMLTFPPSCMLAKLGGKCITCGGTHFVNYITIGRIADAFNENQFLFILTIFFAISIIFLNIYWLSGSGFAKKALSMMYNIPVLIIILASMLLFFVIRNIPFFIRVIEYIKILSAQ